MFFCDLIKLLVTCSEHFVKHFHQTRTKPVTRSLTCVHWLMISPTLSTQMPHPFLSLRPATSHCLTLRALFKHGRCQHDLKVAYLISSWSTGPLAPPKETPSHLVAQIGKPSCLVAIANISKPSWCSHTNISCCAQHPRLTVYEWKRKPVFDHF